MQNVFALAPIINAAEGGLSAAQNSTCTKNENLLQGAGLPETTGPFASFLAEWLCAVEQLESGETSETGSIDLTFSAEEGKKREERSLSFPLSRMNDASLVSKSVLDLMASLQTGLKEKGIDTGTLPPEMGDALEGVLPGMDMERLKAFMAGLQNRYPMTVESAGPRHLDIEVSLTDTLTFGVEASLNPAEEETAADDTPVNENTGEQDTAVASAVSANMAYSLPPGLQGEASQSLSETDLSPANDATPLTVSRLFSYLKADTPRLVPAVSHKMETMSTNDGDTPVGSRDKKAGTTVAKNTESSTVPERLPVAEGGASQEKSPMDGGDDSNRDKNRSRDDLTASSKTTEKNELEKQPRTTSAEQKTNFEQFFDGIMARRNQTDVRPGAMELVKENPGARNEALREGLDNVVRFIRTSGEQKAALIVDPPALGRISIELVNGTTGLEASVKVSSEQVRQLVQDQIVQLRMSLAQQGVQLTHFSVDVQQDNGRQDQRQEQRRGRSVRGISGEDVPDDAQDEQTMFRVDLNQGLLYWVA